jgi:chromate transporter
MRHKDFLKDVLICSFGAFGGPEAHYGVFMDQMVIKKKYLTEIELGELIGLTSLLPGPSSTQTIVAIGYQKGGILLALLTFLVWALPAILLMSGVSFLYTSIDAASRWMVFIPPMAIGFIYMAGYRLSRKVLQSKLSWVLFLSALLITLFIRVFWIFPILLIVGGLFYALYLKESGPLPRISLKPSFQPFLILIGIALLLEITLWFSDHALLELMEHMFRYGYLIIGGGQVVIPYMLDDFVYQLGWLSEETFLIGYGLVQGIPGPMFSFSAFAGGVAFSNETMAVQFLASIVSALMLFLPGILLIFMVFPMWDQLKEIKAIKHFMRGVSIVAAALIVSSGLTLHLALEDPLSSAWIILVTMILLRLKKVPTPIIVVLFLVIGYVSSMV